MCDTSNLIYSGLSADEMINISLKHIEDSLRKERSSKAYSLVGFDWDDRLFIRLKKPRPVDAETLDFYFKGEYVRGFDPIHKVEETPTEYILWQYSTKHVIKKDSFDEIRLLIHNTAGVLDDWEI